jgi:hypothetical protein
MKTYKAEASATINAPAALVYSIIADYRDGHPHILPKPYFLGLEVERGGFGAGTVIRFRVRVMGKTQAFRAAVTEPEPGRVLVESDLDGGPQTTFTVEPLEEGRRARHFHDRRRGALAPARPGRALRHGEGAAARLRARACAARRLRRRARTRLD